MDHKLDAFLSNISPFGPALMGIVNVTPDSFSDGGQFYNSQDAINHGLTLIAEGAHILDIGGESTRPGAAIISTEEELERVIPVIQGLRKNTHIPISIDTRCAKVMEAALEAGASIVNDVSALTHDPESLGVVARKNIAVCLMHMQGTPQTMQDNPDYGDVVTNIMQYFDARMKICIEEGINEENIILDPGIGFGKTLDHNLQILKHLQSFKSFGRPVLLGASRKSFISMASNNEPAQERLAGSIAVALWGAEQRADILRIHDVAQTRQALAIQNAILSVQ